MNLIISFLHTYKYVILTEHIFTTIIVVVCEIQLNFVGFILTSIVHGKQ